MVAFAPLLRRTTVPFRRLNWAGEFPVSTVAPSYKVAGPGIRTRPISMSPSEVAIPIGLTPAIAGKHKAKLKTSVCVLSKASTPLTEVIGEVEPEH